MNGSARMRMTDTKTPRFSWSILSGKADDRQTAYDLTVWHGGTCLYTAGWTESGEQSCVYAGNDLPAGQELTLKITLRDRDGNESEPYAGSFRCGVLEDWTGRWIGCGEDNGRKVLYFRRDFTLERDDIKEACLFVAGIGYHSILLNGGKIDDAVMDPAFSDYRKSCYYAVLPVDPAQIRKGKNTVGIEVANGWRKNPDPLITAMANGKTPPIFGEPALNAVLKIFFADGTEYTLSTDDSWSWKYGAVTEAHIFDGETYDARLSDPDWAGVMTEPEGFRPAAVTAGPEGVLRPMGIAPVREQEIYRPVEITEPEKGTFIADFGQNLAGVARLRLPALMKDDTVTIRYSEELDEEGFLFTEPLREAKQCDTYIASGDERDLVFWQQKFTYHGFRYAEIRGLRYLTAGDICAVAEYTDAASGSTFRCGSPVVNAIQKLVVQTEKANIHSILTDCPQRNERMAWMNDATVRYEETPYNFRVYRLFAKVVHDIMDTQNEEGAFCCCSPRISFGGIPADPVCSSFLVAVKEAYMHTGNRALVEEAFDALAAWENCLLTRSDGYIVTYSYYGDWAGPGYACVGGDDGAKSAVTIGILMSTGYSYFNSRTLAEFAGILGREDDRMKWTETAGKIRDAFLAKWWDPATAKVGTGSQGSQAFALWLGILPEDKRQAAADVLHRDLAENDYRFTTGNLCTRYMMDALTEYGYLEDAWTLLTKETYPSFGYMLQNEATTVWERFELKKNPDMNSHNHPMYGAVGYWFYAYLCGVVPTEPAYRRVRIRPYYPEKLLSAQCCVETEKGQIAVRWNKRYGSTILAVSIPVGVTADIDVNGTVRTCGAGYHHFSF